MHKAPAAPNVFAASPGLPNCLACCYCLLLWLCVCNNDEAQFFKTVEFFGVRVMLHRAASSRRPKMVCVALEQVMSRQYKTDALTLTMMVQHGSLAQSSRSGVIKCVRHGGGNRCTYIDEDGQACEASARISKSGTGAANKCVRHGGGNRCTHSDEDGQACKSSAENSRSGTGAVGRCKRHGGGNRCTHIDKDGQACKSSAENNKSDVHKCVRHGGGNRCTHIDDDGQACTVSAQNSKSGTGSTGRCRRHGGGDRCAQDCCVSVTEDGLAAVAKGEHPEDGTPMCTYAMRCMVNSERNQVEKMRLMKLFGFKKDLVLRGEHVFYHALCLFVPGLQLSERVLDESVLKKQQGKHKSNEDPRPDYYYYFGYDQHRGFALHGEYDETPDHEDSDDRLEVVAAAANVPLSKTYFFRVQGNHYSTNAVCRRVSNKDHTYYTLTDKGRSVVAETARVVLERL
jgi:hypothetical protein